MHSSIEFPRKWIKLDKWNRFTSPANLSWGLCLNKVINIYFQMYKLKLEDKMYLQV